MAWYLLTRELDMLERSLFALILSSLASLALREEKKRVGWEGIGKRERELCLWVDVNEKDMGKRKAPEKEQCFWEMCYVWVLRIW